MRCGSCDAEKPADASFRRPGLTAFTGRAHEFATLQQTLEIIATGTVKAIGISGVPGSGKSRLCYEFAQWCRARRVPVFEARTQSHDRATPLRPAVAILRLLLGVSTSDEPAAARRRIAHEFSALEPSFVADSRLLYEFLGIPEDDNLPMLLHPKGDAARLLDLLRRVMRHRGAAATVMLIEDVHWLDVASEEFIATLIDAVADAHAMLVVSYDPGHKAAWMKLPHFQELALPEFTAEETEGLVADLMGPRLELCDIREQVVERSGGNPFFVEELVRSLAESGEICGETGNYHRGTNFDERPLPATVEGVIGARIDRLDESARSLLQIAAVIGLEFPLCVLQQVARQSLPRVNAILIQLSEAELIYERPTIGSRTFSFRHPVIQDVAYAMQLTAKRRQLHDATARAIEAFYGDHLNECAGLLAYHSEAAGKLVDAARYAARTAMWVGLINREQAIEQWQKVRQLLHGLPRSPARDSQLVMANAQMAWFGWRRGMTAEAVQEVIREGLELARETDDPMLPMLLFADGRAIFADGGSADTYVARLEEALPLARKTGNLGRIATISCALSQAYGWAGLLNQALIASDAALEQLPHVERFDHEFLGYNVGHWVLTLRARILVRLGRFAEGKQALDVLIAIEDQVTEPTVRFISHLGYVDLAWCRGDAGLAAVHARRIADIGNKSGITYVQIYGFSCQGTAELLAGNFSAAERNFTASLRSMHGEMGTVSIEIAPEVLASLADCYLQMSRPVRALAAAEQALAMARQRDARLPQCRSLIIRGSALLALPDAAGIEEAQRSFHEAEELIGVTGAKIYEPLLARARAEAARVARR